MRQPLCILDCCVLYLWLIFAFATKVMTRVSKKGWSPFTTNFHLFCWFLVITTKIGNIWKCNANFHLFYQRFQKCHRKTNFKKWFWVFLKILVAKFLLFEHFLVKCYNSSIAKINNKLTFGLVASSMRFANGRKIWNCILIWNFKQSFIKMYLATLVWAKIIIKR